MRPQKTWQRPNFCAFQGQETKIIVPFLTNFIIQSLNINTDCKDSVYIVRFNFDLHILSIVVSCLKPNTSSFNKKPFFTVSFPPDSSLRVWAQLQIFLGPGNAPGGSPYVVWLALLWTFHLNRSSQQLWTCLMMLSQKGCCWWQSMGISLSAMWGFILGPPPSARSFKDYNLENHYRKAESPCNGL